MNETVFECQKCGACCEGRGGIVLGPADIARIATLLGIGTGLLRERYLCESNGKTVARTGADGFCIFFKKNSGCTVHHGKPDICRAWPFFRGNLKDPVSLEMAKAFCPGINSRVSHLQFRDEGLRWLLKEKLLADDQTHEANALALSDL